MPETIVDKVMQDWVYSGRLQAMTAEEVEEAIHRNAAEVSTRAKTSPAWADLLPSVALPSPQDLEPITISESVAFPSPQDLEPITISEEVVEDKEWDKPPLRISPGRKRRGKREFLDPKVLLGPGNPFEKAKLLGVSHMTVRRAIKELEKEGK